MNFFYSGCLTRSCRLPFLNNQCCKERIVSFPLSISDDKNTHKKQTIKLLENIPCYSKHRFLPSWNSWTQVRFKDNLQLHRDIRYPNFDDYRKEAFKDVRKTHWGQEDSKYGVVYAIGYFGLLCGAYSLKVNLIMFISCMDAPADVLALAVAEIDISKVPPGGCTAFKWRGKPLFVKNRTAQEIQIEAATPLSSLRDPEKPEQRVQRPEWLVVLGICTHLGCVPIHNAGDYVGGFYCPCHGSHFDNVGRARKGPAPTNLEIPPYTFLSDTVIKVG